MQAPYEPVVHKNNPPSEYRLLSKAHRKRLAEGKHVGPDPTAVYPNSPKSGSRKRSPRTRQSMSLSNFRALSPQNQAAIYMRLPNAAQRNVSMRMTEEELDAMMEYL